MYHITIFLSTVVTQRGPFQALPTPRCFVAFSSCSIASTRSGLARLIWLARNVAALGASGAQVVVVTPAHQSPTGVVLAATRRHAPVPVTEVSISAAGPPARQSRLH